jgi:nitroimidazol reductase NimA-like FMN-containing flavoprotein (pyridoxamine 5'-phosphate oxidase superfamily)
MGVSRPTSDRVRLRRGAKKGRYDRATIHAVLDRGLFGHVAFATGADVYCVPMLCARVQDRIYIHGSTASRALRTLAGGAPACVTVTVLDGLVLARSVFEHSANYESVMALGRFEAVAETAERLAALEAFTEKLLPGRWSEVRAPSRQELKGTTILAMPLSEASAKVRSGPPDDDDSPDAAIDTWAGVIPLVSSFGSPIASPGLTPGTPLSASVRRLLTDTRLVPGKG